MPDAGPVPAPAEAEFVWSARGTGVLRPEERKVVLLLEGEWQQAEAAQKIKGKQDLGLVPRSVLIAGEVGSGKSALAAFLSGTQAQDDGGQWYSELFPIGHASNPQTDRLTSAECHWFDDDSKGRVRLSDLPGWGDPRPGKDDENFQSLVRFLAESAEFHALLVVLEPKVRLHGTTRRMLELLEKACSKRVWQNVIFVVNKWPHDQLSKTKRARGDWTSSDHFERQMRAVLAMPKRSDSVEEENEHFGLGLAEEVAHRVPFFFVDTHYDRASEVEETSVFEQFDLLRAIVETMPAAQLQFLMTGAAGAAARALAAAVRSYKPEQLEEVLATARSSGELKPSTLAAVDALFECWQAELERIRSRVEAAWEGGEPEQLQTAVRAAMASPLGRKSRELREEIALLQQGHWRTGATRDLDHVHELAKLMAECMLHKHGRRSARSSKEGAAADGGDSAAAAKLKTELQCTFKYPTKDSGEVKAFDIRESVCEVFGAHHGDVVVSEHDYVATVIGVAHIAKPMLFCHADFARGAGVFSEDEQLKVLGTVRVEEGGSHDGAAPSASFVMSWLQPTFFYPIGRNEVHRLGCFDIRDDVCEKVGELGLRHGEVVSHPRVRNKLVVVGVMYDPIDNKLQLWFRQKGDKGVGVFEQKSLRELKCAGQKERLREVPANKRASLNSIMEAFRGHQGLRGLAQCDGLRPDTPRPSGPSIGQTPSGGQDAGLSLLREIQEAEAQGRNVDLSKVKGWVGAGSSAGAAGGTAETLLQRMLEACELSARSLGVAEALVGDGAKITEKALALVVDGLAAPGLPEDVRQGWIELLKVGGWSGFERESENCASPVVQAVFVEVSECGIDSANGVYTMQPELQNGRPYWVNQRGQGYALAWSIGDCKQWGLYERALLDESRRFSSSAPTEKLPCGKWRATCGPVNAPVIRAAAGHERWRFHLGDPVCVHADVDTVRSLGDSFGPPCTSKVQAMCGEEGVVAAVDKEGAVKVAFSDCGAWFSPLALIRLPQTESTSNAAWLRVSGCDISAANGTYYRRKTLRNGRPCWNCGACEISWNVGGCGAWGLYKDQLGPKHQIAQSELRTLTLPLGPWQATGSSTVPPTLEEVDLAFCPGDMVRIKAAPSEVEALQEAHGGWHAGMAPYCGRAGFVSECSIRTVQVDFGEVHFHFNRQAVHALEGEQGGWWNEPSIRIVACGISGVNGIDYAIAWDVDESKTWGIYVGAYELERQCFRNSEGFPGLPVRGWQCVKNPPLAPPVFERWDMPVVEEGETPEAGGKRKHDELKEWKELLSLLRKEEAGLGGALGGVPLHELMRPSTPEPPSSLPESRVLAAELVEVDRGSALGEGGLGVVLQGRFTGEAVALKAVNEQHRGSRDELVQECSMLAQLQHPNIVQVFGVCEKDGRMYIVMELCKGGSLLNYIGKDRKATTLGQRCHMAIEMCRALEYLHHRRVRHGDLKPGNALVTESLRCKLCDFNLAQFVPASRAAKPKGGTTAYAAPEVLCGNPVDFSADVFSLGVCLFELLSLQSCMDALQLRTERGGFWVFAEDGHDDAVARLWPKEVPVATLKSLRQCWHKDPSARPKVKDLCRSLGNSASECSVQ